MAKKVTKSNLHAFGAHLQKLREEQGLSYRQMATACDIDHSKIAKIEKGQVNITLTTVFQLAKALSVSPAQLFDADFE